MFGFPLRWWIDAQLIGILVGIVLLVVGCAVQPFTVPPLTLSQGVAPMPVVAPLQNHIRLPSCGQCHR